MQKAVWIFRNDIAGTPIIKNIRAPIAGEIQAAQSRRIPRRAHSPSGGWRRCAAPFLLKKRAGKENCFSVLKPAAVSDKIDRTSLNRGARCLDAKQRLSAFKAEIVKRGTILGTGSFMAFCADSVSCGDQYETALCGRRARHVRGGCGYLNVS